MIRMGARIEKASDYCTFCPKLCRFACPAANAEARETVTPWGMMSLLHMVRRGEVELSPEIGEVFFHCTGCLRCQTWCKHRNDVPEALMAARRAMVDRGVPLPAALQGIDLAYEQHGSPLGAAPDLDPDVAAAFDPGSDVAYIPEASRRVLDPGSLRGVGRALQIALGRKAALVESLDGQPIHDSGEALRWSGHVSWSEMWQDNLVRGLDDKILIVTEAAGFAERWARSSGEGTRVIHLIELLSEHAASLGAARTRDPLAGRRVVYHDSCGVGRRLEQYEGPRVLVEALTGRPPEELWLSRAQAICCGAGAHYPAVDPTGAARAAELLAEALRDHGAEVVITAEQGCQHHMLRAVPGLQVLDLIALVALTCDE